MAARRPASTTRRASLASDAAASGSSSASPTTRPTLVFMAALLPLACAAPSRDGASWAMQGAAASSERSELHGQTDDVIGRTERTASTSGPTFMPDLFPTASVGEALKNEYPILERMGWTDNAMLYQRVPLMKRPLPPDLASHAVLPPGANCSDVEAFIDELGTHPGPNWKPLRLCHSPMHALSAAALKLSTSLLVAQGSMVLPRWCFI